MKSRLDVTHIVLAALAVVIGMVVGGLGPRAELRELRAEMDTLLQRSTAGPNVGDALTAALITKAMTGGEAPTRAQVDNEETEEGRAVRDDRGDREVRGSTSATALAEERRSRAQTMAYDSMELRRAQARAAVVEVLDPSSRQLEELDQVTEDMNSELIVILEGALDKYDEAGGDLSRRDFMETTVEALDTILAAEDEMMGSMSGLPVDQLDAAALDPISYLDPMVTELLTEIGR